jgi:orotidine-5'-phosphate decarboxylase
VLVHPVGGVTPAGSKGSPVAFALDFSDVEKARAAAVAVRDAIGMLKVGLELFVSTGPRAVKLGEETGLPVFLDLKLHDIPETVERAVAGVARLGARFVTVHATGGKEMLRRAVRRAKDEGAGLEVVAVTVLTSFDAADLGHIGALAGATPESQALRLARLAYDEGVRAFVSSPRELRMLRKELGPDVVLITPGIRPAGLGAGDDQKRVATVTEAIRDGADWVVVGRPIRDAKDPRVAAQAMTDEARRAADSRGS